MRSKLGKIGIATVALLASAQAVLAQNALSDIGEFLRPAFSTRYWAILAPLLIGFFLGWLHFFKTGEKSKNILAHTAKAIGLVLFIFVAHIFASVFSRGGSIDLGLTFGWISFMAMSVIGIFYRHIVSEGSKRGRGSVILPLITAFALSGIIAGPGGIARDPLSFIQQYADIAVYQIKIVRLLFTWAVISAALALGLNVFFSAKNLFMSKSEREERRLGESQQRERTKREEALTAEVQEANALRQQFDKKKEEYDAKIKMLEEERKNAEQAKTVLQTNAHSDAAAQILNVLFRGVPAFGSQVSQFNPMLNLQQVSSELNAEIAAKQKLISQMKENFASTAPGKKAYYLMQLREDLKKNPAAYLGTDLNMPNTAVLKAKVIADINDKDLAEYLGSFSSPNLTTNEFVGLLIKRILEPKLRELVGQRTRMIKLNTSDLNYLIKKNQDTLRQYQAHDVYMGNAAEVVRTFNQGNEQMNRKIDALQQTIKDMQQKIQAAPSEAVNALSQSLIPLIEEAMRNAQQEKVAAEKGIAAAKQAEEVDVRLRETEEDVKKKLKGFSTEEQAV